MYICYYVSMLPTLLLLLLVGFILYYLIYKYVKSILATKDSTHPVYSKLDLMTISKKLDKIVGKHDKHKYKYGIDEKHHYEMGLYIGKLGDQYKFMIQANIDVSNGKKTIEQVWEEEGKLVEKGSFEHSFYSQE